MKKTSHQSARRKARQERDETRTGLGTRSGRRQQARAVMAPRNSVPRRTAPHRSLDDRVRNLAHRFRLGRFDKALFDEAEALLGQTRTLDPQDDPVLLKCRCVVSEILDLQGRLALAQAASREGEAVFASLQTRWFEAGQFKLVREQLRFVADFAHFHFYRRRKFGAARNCLKFCASIIEKRLRPKLSCHGTMALILYYMGCAERQLGNLDRADACYGGAINEYLDRANTIVVDSQRRDEELSLARHNVAIVLGLGLG